MKGFVYYEEINKSLLRSQRFSASTLLHMKLESKLFLKQKQVNVNYFNIISWLISSGYQFCVKQRPTWRYYYGPAAGKCGVLITGLPGKSHPYYYQSGYWLKLAKPYLTRYQRLRKFCLQVWQILRDNIRSLRKLRV